jgi:hypothetical protein
MIFGREVMPFRGTLYGWGSKLLLECTIFSLAQQRFGIVCIVVLLWLHHIQSLADLTMVTKVCNLL